MIANCGPRRSTAALARFATPALMLVIGLSASSAQTFSPPSRILPHGRPPSVVVAPPVTKSSPARTNNVQAWGPLFRTQVDRCWKKPYGARRVPIEAEFSLKLRRDGMIDDLRLVSIAPNTTYAQAYLASSLQALKACQPYHLPDLHYEEWRSFKPVFTERPPEMPQR